jgi:hypothetical protein
VVHDSINRTYSYILECTYPGYAFLLDLLLQFCTTESAVLEIRVSNYNNASSSMVQSPCLRFCYLLRPFWRWASAAAVFQGRRSGFHSRGRQQCRGGIMMGGVDRGINGIGVGVVGGNWHGCSLGDEDCLAAGLPPEQDFLRMFS